MARLLWFLIAVISSLMLASWLFGRTLPWTLSSKNPQMAFNASLCFLILSLAALFRQWKWLQKSWLVVFAISLLSLLQYLLSTNLGIDEVFLSGLPIGDFNAAPGLLPASSFCLLLAALAQGGTQERNSQSSFPWTYFSLSLFAAVAFLGVSSTIFYLNSPSSPISWGNPAKIPFLTAFCFVLLGLAGVFESSKHISARKGSGWTLAGIVCGTLLLLLTFMSWEYRHLESSEKISQRLFQQAQARSQNFTQSLHSLAQEFEKLQIPANPKSDWRPPLPGAQAVIRLGATSSVIWSQEPVDSQKELPVLTEQLSQDPKFHFYESLTFQRNRWMGFSEKGILLLFTPLPLIAENFPPQEFLFSLQSQSEILFTNATVLPARLQAWSVRIPLSLWNRDMFLELNPTSLTLAALGSSHFLPFLLAGFGLSLAIGVIFSLVPVIQKRFSR